MDILTTANSFLQKARDTKNKIDKPATNLIPGQLNSTSSIGDASSQYEFSKYDIKNHVYPTDLLDPKTLKSKNYVMFFINTSVDSSLIKNNKAEVVEGVERNTRGALISQNVQTKDAIAGAGILGTGVGAGVGAIIKNPGSAAIGGGISAGLAGLIAVNSNNGEAAPGEVKQSTFARPQKRLKTAIALYVPNQLSISYQTEWGTADTAAFAAGAKGYSEVADMVKGKDAKVGGLAAEVTTALGLTKAPGGAALGIASGLAANPKKEQQFSGVEFRSFTFDYNFAPRDSNEAKVVLNIIKQFKYHMHPEFKPDSPGFLYIYPSEFDITYYNGASENLNLHRHTSCVLTNMNVNYSPNGQFVTFPDGMPTQINISLQFRELMALSKENIDKNL